MPEAEDEVPGATDELVAALAGGAALSFEPEADDDDLLPGDRVARAEAADAEAPPEATPEEIAAELAREAAEKNEDDPLGRTAGRLSRPATRAGRPGAAHDTNTPRPAHPARAAAEQETRTGMADISAELVKELRERTGAGFMDCKRALDRGRRRPREGDRSSFARRASRRPRRRPAARPARASSRATSTPAAASAC